MPPLQRLQRPLLAQPLAIGGALLWGAIEVLALWRSRLARRISSR